MLKPEPAWLRQIFESLFDIAFGYRVAIRCDIPKFPNGQAMNVKGKRGALMCEIIDCKITVPNVQLLLLSK